MLVVGYFAIQNAQVDVFPEFAPPRVEIQTVALGLSPTEVESLVTVPLEQSLEGTPGLDIIRSKSVSQLSSIELQFQRSADLFHARQLVNERIAVATPLLPTWAAPPVMLQPLSTTSRRDEDRAPVEHDEPDRSVDDRVLEDPGAAARDHGCRERPDLGRAGRGVPRADRPGEAHRLQRLRSSG